MSEWYHNALHAALDVMNVCSSSNRHTRKALKCRLLKICRDKAEFVICDAMRYQYQLW